MKNELIKTTEALSVSRVLPDGCLAYRNGLHIPPGMSYEQWMKLGSQISELTGSVFWLLGDWFAYGQQHYHGLEGFERIENGIYAKMAELTGLSEQRLRNAKWVASKVNLSRRRDKLTFSLAEEIVGRAHPSQFDYWIDKAVTPNPDGKMPTVRQLREELRKAKAVHKTEPQDHGVTSSLAITDQYVRDIMAIEDISQRQIEAHVRNLQPVLRRFGIVR